METCFFGGSELKKQAALLCFRRNLSLVTFFCFCTLRKEGDDLRVCVAPVRRGSLFAYRPFADLLSLPVIVEPHDPPVATLDCSRRHNVNT